MKFVYEPELVEYMQEKGHKNIVVEVVTINNSEIEISELHVHFVDERQTEIFKTKCLYKGTGNHLQQSL